MKCALIIGYYDYLSSRWSSSEWLQNKIDNFTKWSMRNKSMLFTIWPCIFRAITDDDANNMNDGSDAYSTAKVLRDVRTLMNDTSFVGLPIQAYIVPSVDAHQVTDEMCSDLWNIV